MSIGIGVPSAASPLLAELRALTRDRERLVWNQRDVENQLRAIVQVYHPGVLHLFSSLDRDIALAFLRDYPTPAHAGRIGSARMAAFCARHGYSGRTARSYWSNATDQSAVRVTRNNSRQGVQRRTVRRPARAAQHPGPRHHQTDP